MPRLNRGARQRQAAETGKAIGTNGLQVGRNSQGYQNLGRRLCGVRTSGYHDFPSRAEPASAYTGSESRSKTISDRLVEIGLKAEGK